MKVKIRKSLLKESNFDDEMESFSVDSVYDAYDLYYCNFEENRKMIAMQIDRNILTPAMQMKDAESEDVKTVDYLARTRDVVKQGRKIPYLYYAYKGIDENGNILREQNLNVVLEMQLEKAKLFKENLKTKGGGEAIALFLCDFGLITKHQMSWDRAYEKTVKRKIPSKTYQRIGMQKGYDRGEFQAGRGMFPMPMSTVAIGKATKPLYAQNVDFMYKTSPEPNLNIDEDDLWAFSLNVPLSIAYLMMAYNTNTLVLNEPEKISVRAYQHWATNEEKYRRQYAKMMEKEIYPVSDEPDVTDLYDALKNITSGFTILPQLTFSQFNSNYVENTTTVESYKEKKAPPHPIRKMVSTGPAMNPLLIASQPGGMDQLTDEGLGEILNNPTLNHQYQEYISQRIEDMNKGDVQREISTNAINNLRSYYIRYFEELSEADKEWMLKSIQEYFQMGGR